MIINLGFQQNLMKHWLILISILHEENIINKKILKKSKGVRLPRIAYMKASPSFKFYELMCAFVCLYKQ